MYILYGEDDLDDFEIFLDTVRSIDAKIACIHARNGNEVLQILNEATILPNVIFPDINMPSLDGKGCLKALKLDKRFSAIPVVMYTTSTNKSDERQCRELGAFEYLRKPNSVLQAVSELEARFERIKV